MAQATERKIPSLLIAGGLVLYVVAALIRAGTGSVMPVLVAAIVALVVQTILLIASAFVIAAILRISFGDSNSAMLKFAAAVIASGSIEALIPTRGILATAVFFVLVLWLFELDVAYVVALMVGYFLIGLFVTLATARIWVPMAKIAR